jgi:hypothetical protein
MSAALSTRGRICEGRDEAIPLITVGRVCYLLGSEGLSVVLGDIATMDYVEGDLAEVGDVTADIEDDPL